MIYAAVKFLQEWHTPLTVANFTLLGIASGFLLAAGYSAWRGNQLVAFFGTWAVIATLLALVTRLAATESGADLEQRKVREPARLVPCGCRQQARQQVRAKM